MSRKKVIENCKKAAGTIYLEEALLIAAETNHALQLENHRLWNMLRKK